MRLREGAERGGGAGGWLQERNAVLVSELEIDGLKSDPLV